MRANNSDAQDSDLDPLIHDLVEWVAKQERPYKDVLEAWRTSCPRLMVWEAATDRGFVIRAVSQGGQPIVIVTPSGRTFLSRHGSHGP